MNVDRWFRLLANIGLATDEDTYHKLVSAYAEKHRAYHTARHINDCLEKLDLNLDLVDSPYYVEMAIWFHDAVYRPVSKSNEEDSAQWAMEFLISTNANATLVKEITDLVMATKHDGHRHCGDASVLVDIDLSILGSSDDDYDQFEKHIRTEYRLVPNFVYSKKRAELLSRFLSHDTIFLNKRFRDRYENQANRNVSRTLERLLS